MCNLDQDSDLIEPEPPEEDMTYGEEGAIMAIHEEQEEANVNPS